MYERFYRLRERPFALTPDLDYLYLSPNHRDALDHLRLGLEAGAGFVVLTGEIGCGKTTLLQTLVTSLDGRTLVARLVDTLLEPAELIEALLIDFGVDQIPATKPAMVRELARVLIDQHTLGRRVVVIIDEAQNLTRRALEEVRMLSNLETEKSKLMQILLVGQPGFRQTLASPALEQLRQRVTVRFHLDPLSVDDTANYINHRLRLAAIDQPLVFSRAITDAIHTRTRGVPRMINVVCDAILLAGYSEEQRGISLALTQTVFEDLERMGLMAPRTGPSLAVTSDRGGVNAPRQAERVAAWPAGTPAVTPMPAKEGPR
jgi:general secretion pathway protein A